MDTAREFVLRLAAALAREHADLADFLILLAEFHRRRFWIDLGHASLYSFLTRELGLSSGAAQYRKTAAELIERHPEVESALRSGKLCLSSVIELAKVLTPENQEDVLPRFLGLSAREAREVAVAIRPVEDPPYRLVVTPLPPSPAQPVARVVPQELDPAPPLTSEVAQPSPLTSEVNSDASRAPAAARPNGSAAAATAAPPRDEIEPLTATLRRMHVTVSRNFLEKLEAARAALSHSNPGASYEEILEKGLDLVIERHAKRRGLVQKPRSGRPAKPTTVTAAVKRAVWLRAKGRCQFPLASGGVCGSRTRLENAHLTPKALGGPPTVEGLDLHCKFHNLLTERRDFGDAFVDRFTRAKRRGTEAGRPAADRKRARGAPP